MDEKKNNGNNGTVLTTEVAPQLKKQALKKIIKQRTREKWEEEIEGEKKEKSKIKHWNNLTTNTSTKRPEYMEKLTRKESQAMLRARTSMMNVRMNYKNGQEKQTQVQILQRSWRNPRTRHPGLPENKEKRRHYQVRRNGVIARALYQINNTLDETQ